jgi:peptidoglycan/xylan/chitin deacetylase (PgdA/CDA1 family)
VRAWRRTSAGDQEAFVQAVEQAAEAKAVDAPREHPVFMTWDEVKRLRALGHTVGAHTHSHPILASLSAEEQRQELAASRALLEQQLGGPVRLIAYPNGLNGSFTSETKRLARECGFEAAFSFHGGTNPPRGFDAFDLKRGHVLASESRALFCARVALPSILARETRDAVTTAR